ncbi:tetratricopeptide repeat protein [Photobacterium sp. GJ3]|uniref:tetratricopeptide repeat protein n=1 Tax=Photobacterium sp. GJ3 TaxID=2829502 RepID=UPI002010C82E|nr:tetratricopeptide repeat protein [Photobacterium sp. GJ3]
MFIFAVLPVSAASPESVCASCHEKQVKDWQASHHFHAMEVATADSVLANFEDVSIDYMGKPARFFQADQQYWTEFFDEQGEKHRIALTYTFGYKPLQQYLFDAGKGKQQFIPFAWDSRRASEGGQRWFVLHPEQTPSDSFHWTQMGQNWNQMCADCHSTDFQKNYDATTQSYQSSFSAINVSCNACHGDATDHLAWAHGDKNVQHKGYPTEIGVKTPLFRLNTAGKLTPVTPLKGSQQIEVCASCHARRAQLADRNLPAELLNAFQPSLITSGLYHADGQIDDEVYVWGSFLQTKMYQAGVTCTNCHNPHSGELKLAGNQTCTQCHATDTYDTEKHHRHSSFAAGNQCVDCHMTENTYMQVDARRDHSFRIPRPDLTASTGSPNACQSCHADKTASWAAQKVKSWYPESQLVGSPHFSRVFHAADTHQLQDSAELSKIAQDKNYPDIIRASALSRMSVMPDRNAVVAIVRSVKEDEPLKRLGAISAAENFPIHQKWRMLSSLLTDDRVSIRTAAARTLAPILNEPVLTSGISDSDRHLLLETLTEYKQAQYYQADRGFSHAALGNLAAALHDPIKAISHFEAAMAVEPHFIPAYVNLADLYRAQGNEEASQQTLKEGLKRSPRSAPLNYAMAMSLIRAKDKKSAVSYLTLATEYESENQHYHYTLSLLLKDLGKQRAAMQAMYQAYQLNPSSPDFTYALSQAYTELGDYKNALFYAQRLKQLLPDNPQVTQYIYQLQMAIQP